MVDPACFSIRNSVDFFDLVQVYEYVFSQLKIFYSTSSPGPKPSTISCVRVGMGLGLIKYPVCRQQH